MKNNYDNSNRIDRMRKQKERELHEIDGYSETSGSKVAMYVLLAITLVSVVSYFIYTVIQSNEIIEQLTTIISTSLLAMFTVFFLIQSLFLDNQRGRKFVVISSFLLTSYSVFNILTGMNILKIPTQEYVPNFTGKNLTEVVEWTTKNKVELDQIYETSDIVEQYAVINQDVEAGTLVKDVKKVTVVVSEGPNYDKEVVMPNFIGRNVDDVIEFVDENHLTGVNIDFKFSEIEREQILEQDKSGQIKRNDTVNMVASLGAEEDLGPVAMKNLVGLDTFHATTWVKRFGLKYTLEYEYSDTVEKGYVLKQSIPEGEQADPQTTTVVLTISKGPKIKVPDLTKMSVDEITEWVIQNHLKIAFEEKYDEAVQVGGVISVNVEEGEEIEQGTLITVVISKGQLKMESFTSAVDFRAWAESYGINYKEEYEFNNGVASGMIIRSSHEAGQIIKNTDTVIIYVSQGKSIEIPNFVGSSKADIQKKCSQIGLKCSFSYGGFNNSVAKDVAIAQSKRNGSKVASGTNVAITLSSGKAQKYTIVIQPNWLSAGNADMTISTLKSKLESACPGVTFRFQKKTVNTGVGLITPDSPVKGGNNTFVQGQTYTIYIGS